jgi:hypothetical protein
VDLTKLRKFSLLQQQRSSWYKRYCEEYDKGDLVTLRRTVCSQPKLFALLSPYLGWYEGRPGPQITRQELFTIRFPRVLNECTVCKSLTTFSAREWRTTCSMKCAAQACTPKRKSTSLKRYGVDNPGKSQAVKKKRLKTFRKKFGTDNPFQNKSVKQKIKNTNLSRYGVENASQSSEVKAKKVATFQNNYGADHWSKVLPTVFVTDNPMRNAKSVKRQRATNLERYGYENAAQSKVVQDKMKATFLTNYGVDNPRKAESVKNTIQNTNLERYGVTNAGALFNTPYTRKVYKDKMGRTHYVQGYEDIMMRIFEGIPTVSKLFTGSRNVIRVLYKDKDGKVRNYYPDIRVETTSGSRSVIEVKSTYTLKADLDTNVRKFKAATKFCLKKGLTFWVCVVLPKDNSVIRCKNPTSFGDLKRAGLLASRPRD